MTYNHFATYTRDAIHLGVDYTFPSNLLFATISGGCCPKYLAPFKEITLNLTRAPMSITKHVAQSNIVLKIADITKEQADIIVNAANPSILGGGGVDGAIHLAGGPQILKECLAIREAQKGRGEVEGCSPGHAVITTGGNLKAKFIIHAVGPDMRNNRSDGSSLLSAAYTNSLQLAAKHQAKSIAFPSIATGIYAFPVDKAANIALRSVADFLSHPSCIKEVRFILFSQNDFDSYAEALSQISTTDSLS